LPHDIVLRRFVVKSGRGDPGQSAVYFCSDTKSGS